MNLQCKYICNINTFKGIKYFLGDTSGKVRVTSGKAACVRGVVYTLYFQGNINDTIHVTLT